MSNTPQPSMTDLANAAFQEAAKEVIRRAIETETPVIVWRNGAVVKLDPHQIVLPTPHKTTE